MYCLDIISVLYFTVNTGIILIIIYYTNSIEDTVTVSIIYYCALYYSSAIVYSNMHTGTSTKLYYDTCRYCRPNTNTMLITVCNIFRLYRIFVNSIFWILILYNIFHILNTEYLTIRTMVALTNIQNMEYIIYNIISYNMASYVFSCCDSIATLPVP